MANGRNKNSRVDSGRDPGAFVALPWAVLDCPAYARLSMHARAMLVELARQYIKDNNGRLLMSRAYMAKRGWKSADMIMKTKRELIEAGFIFETVKGYRPNKASWYAVTWRALNRIPGYDVGAMESFVRSAYCRSQPLKNTGLCPSRGTARLPIAPSHGTATTASVPSRGAIKQVSTSAPVPPHGHHLEEPSASPVPFGAKVTEASKRGDGGVGREMRIPLVLIKQ